MIRGFFRLVGLLLLAGGFIFMVYDGARWVADQTLRFTRFGQFWNDIHQSSQQAFHAWIVSKAPWLWTSVVEVLLNQPVFAVLGVVGLLLMLLFRGLVFGMVYRAVTNAGCRTVVILAALVVSHWLLDYAAPPPTTP